MIYYSRRWILVTRIVALIALSISLFGSNALSSVFAACTINGTVYRDYNANGMQDPQEPGVPDITVTAHSATGPVGDDATLTDGTYSITITAAQVPDGDQVRVEFSDIPDYLRTGPFGGESDTTVTFVTCTNVVGGVDLGTANPGQYCNPVGVRLGTPCFVPGDPTTPGPGAQMALVSFDYAAGAPNGAAPVTSPGPFDAPAFTIEATASQIGAVYGLTYQRSTDTYFMSAFLKRHVGYGPQGAGAIYALNRTTGVVTPLTTVGGVGNVVRPGPDGYIRDENVYAEIGKMSLGDMDISEDDTTLYTVNLNTRALVRVTIANGATASFAVPNPGCTNGQFRPFGIGIYDFQVYVGGTCDASAGGTAANLEAIIYVFNPTTNSFNATPVLREPLDYPRRCTDAVTTGCAGGLRNADWQPWNDTWLATGAGVKVRPQPMLADIEFDNGNLILGFRDRMGDQMGNQTYSTIPGDVTLYIGIPAGDVLRACGDPQTGWTLEDNAACGGVTTAGAGNAQGPGTIGGAEGEFYFQDNNALAPPADRHDEITMGGIYQLPGSPDMASIAFDPVPNDSELFDAGVTWFSNTGGTRTRSYRIYDGTFGAATLLGKANGLGSLEATCGPAPLEIGNRVWEDLDRNGRQDPNEMVFAGVTLQLWMDTDAVPGVDTQVGETVTSATGEYYFNYDAIAGAGTVFFAPNDPNTFYDTNGNNTWDSNEPAGILPNTTYEVRVAGGTNYGGGAGILDPYYATTRNTGVLAMSETQTNTFAKPQAQAGSAFTTDIRDSDGVNPTPLALVSAANFPSALLTTGDFGENDHTWDFGFSLIPPNLQTPTPPPGSGGGTPVSASITKSANPPFAMPGDTVTWTITVSNPNSFPLTNVTVTDNMPPEVEITSVSASSGNVSFNGQSVSFSQATLGAGATVTINVVTRVRPNVGTPFSITNGATLVASELPNPLTAQANVVSVGQLPGTGETPWWRTPLIVIAGSFIVLAGWWFGRRARR